MKTLNYQNSLVFKDITGSVKVMELLPVCTDNLDSPNWMYVSFMGVNEIAKFVRTSLSYFFPTALTFTKGRISDTSAYYLGRNHNGDIIVRFSLNCQDRDMLVKAVLCINNILG